MKKLRESEKIIFFAGIAIIVTFMFVEIINIVNEHEITVKVIEKTAKNGYYSIYCEDDDGKSIVLKIKNHILTAKFDSDDMYHKIKAGKKYRFKVRGFRNSSLNLYENIMSFK